MQNIKNTFMNYLDTENKEKAVSFVIEKLECGEIDIVTLYSEVLAPSLYNMTCDLRDRRICVWKENVRASILRTIIECCYPYVVKNKKEKTEKCKAVVLCPPEEYFELNARIMADFFTMAGFEAIFVVGNTPQKDFLNVIDIIRPDVIAISVDNFYNLISTKKIVEKIKTLINQPIKIVVGGNAFENNANNFKGLGADYLVKGFEDINKISD